VLATTHYFLTASVFASVGLSLGEVIRRCRDRGLSKNLLHGTVARAKAGTPIAPDTVSNEFAAARDRAATMLGVELGDSPPTLHEQRSLAARLHEENGRDPQRLLGHRTAKMTGIPRQPRRYVDRCSLIWRIVFRRNWGGFGEKLNTV